MRIEWACLDNARGDSFVTTDDASALNWATKKAIEIVLFVNLSVMEMEIQVCKEIAYFPGVTRH